MNISAVIVAGGMGTRLGAPVPKAFIELGSKPLFIHSLEVFDKYPSVNEIAIIVPEGYEEETEKIIKEFNIDKEVKISKGGKERWNSVKNGVDICSKSEWIMIHDAARPFVTDEVIDSLLRLTNSHKSIITATPVVDTIRTFKEDICEETVDRSKLLRVGTPQLFHRDTLLKAFHKAEEMHIIPTDEAMLMEEIGEKAAFAWGDPLNFKVTAPGDREIAEALIYRRENGKA